MREGFYIEMERLEAVKKEWEEERQRNALYEGITFCTPDNPCCFFEYDFPPREDLPFIRRRSRQQVMEMLEDIKPEIPAAVKEQWEEERQPKELSKDTSPEFPPCEDLPFVRRRSRQQITELIFE